MKHSVNKGFTLIEILVVISVIGILSTLSVGVATVAKARIKTSAAEAVIQRLELALSQYKNDFGCYPPTGNDPNDNSIMIGCLTGDLNGDGKYTGDEGDIPANHPRWKKPYILIDKSFPVRAGKLMDPWDVPYRYWENQRECPRCPYNPNMYLLYSCGPDNKATEGTRDETIDFGADYNRDNIINWIIE